VATISDFSAKLHKDLWACECIDFSGSEGGWVGGGGRGLHKDLWAYECVELGGGEINNVY
jgi:hypothetical protein